jgi:predicted nuclease with RNAse H fold
MEITESNIHIISDSEGYWAVTIGNNESELISLDSPLHSLDDCVAWLRAAEAEAVSVGYEIADAERMREIAAKCLWARVLEARELEEVSNG